MSWTQNGTTIAGPTNNDDTFTGLTPGADSADGQGGGDILYGDGGNDTLEGGAGYDGVYGGTEDDLLTDAADGGNVNGEDGNDTIAITLEGALVDFGAFAFGGAGDDSIAVTGAGLVDDLGAFIGISALGEAGRDTIVTGDSDDFLGGGDDNDSIDAGAGDDAAYGDAGDDTVLGGAGNDALYGETGVGDTIAGRDLLDGGDGDDYVDAEGGDDTVVSSAGVDTAFGGEGINTLDFTGATTGVEMILGQNEIYNDGFDNTEFAEGFTVAIGSAHNDAFFAGSSASDTLLGQAGDDNIFGGQGGDSLSGGTDNDHVIGEEGSDRLLGDAGDDTLIGGRANLNPPFDPETEGADIGGADTLVGGEGGDLLLGMEGNDSLDGGIGNDTIDAGTGDDLAIWRVGDGDDTVAMGEGSDTLYLEGWTGDDTDNWTVNAGPLDSIYSYDDGAGNAYTVTAGGVETIVCFAQGTRILTPRGEVPVETLRAGDLVVAPGAGAPVKPVRWVGRMRVDIARHRAADRAAPVLIRAGALGAGVPARDLRVSPEHALLLHGRLVPARLLVNGTTIVQETWCRAVTYWHVELDAHGVLVAEGALAESYLDDGNRHFFDAGLAVVHPDFGAGRAGGRYAARACAPPILSADDPALLAILAALPTPAPSARSA